MSKRRADRSSIHGWLTQVTAWFVMSAVVLALALSVFIPRLLSATPYTILTGSMKPGMPPGTLVVVKPVTPSEIGIGTVITYQLESGKPTVVTHRVVGQGHDARGNPIFRTQGDANNVEDTGTVLPVQIMGERLYAVPYLGRLGNAVTGSQRDVALLLVITGLLAYSATMFGRMILDRRTGVGRTGLHRSRTAS